MKSIKINGVEIMLEEDCKGCGGKGYGKEGHPVFNGPEIVDYEADPCPYCNGTGKQPIYYTPKQIVEKTGKAIQWHDLVWWYNQGHQSWEKRYFNQVDPVDSLCGLVRVFFRKQPAPPADYIGE